MWRVKEGDEQTEYALCMRNGVLTNENYSCNKWVNWEEFRMKPIELEHFHASNRIH
jgi:hypothetical protein